MTICILGRQPEIGLAELEAIYGAQYVTPIGSTCVLVDGNVDFNRLGGTVKSAALLAKIPVSSSWLESAFKKIDALLPELLQTIDNGKIRLGVSVYDASPSAYELTGKLLRLKKRLRSAGYSVRVVPNESPALSSAQTYHNQLAGSRGLEFVVVQDAQYLYIGRVTDVQNIDAYRIRDRERPKRDAFVGMLPPKLAQIIVNLAVGDAQKTAPICVIDPFCGTGVILQEALLMGHEVYGSDISPKMVDYTKANLTWLQDNTKKPLPPVSRLEVGDATKHMWAISAQPSSSNVHSFCIASEVYLGQPIGGQHPSDEKIREIIHSSNTVIREFLANISSQLASGTRLCLALPAWYIDGRDYHLPVIQDLTALGYTIVTYSHATNGIIYRRDDQSTAREIMTLVKN